MRSMGTIGNLGNGNLGKQMSMIGEMIAIGLTTRKENVVRHRLSDSDR